MEGAESGGGEQEEQVAQEEQEEQEEQDGQEDLQGCSPASVLQERSGGWREEEACRQEARGASIWERRPTATNCDATIE